MVEPGRSLRLRVKPKRCVSDDEATEQEISKFLRTGVDSKLEFEFRKILRHKVAASGTRFLVEWIEEGSTATWEPECNLPADYVRLYAAEATSGYKRLPSHIKGL